MPEFGVTVVDVLLYQIDVSHGHGWSNWNPNFYAAVKPRHRVCL